MIPLCVPFMGPEELEAVKNVLDSGHLAHGPKGKEFEEIFANYIGTEHAVAVNSCASALFLVVKTLGITGEVIIPSFTFSATANAVVTAGATPVFADIQLKTGNLDLESVRSKISSRTEAIMPVHFAGQVCEMDELMDIAEKHKLVVIEDSAETIGGTYGGKKGGAFSHGCFSFYPVKNIATGEGGMITTNDAQLAEKARVISAHGIKKNPETPWKRSASMAGYNFRMSDILAAIGVEQMKKLEKMNNLRRKHAAHLNEGLNQELINLPVESEGCMHVYQMYTVRVDEKIRDKMLSSLRERGVGASIHFDPPVHLQEYYAEHYPADRTELKNTEKLSSSILTLPMFPQLTEEQLDTIIRETNLAAESLS